MLAVQTVFGLLDHLSHWYREQQLAASPKMVKSQPSGAPAKSNLTKNAQMNVASPSGKYQFDMLQETSYSWSLVFEILVLFGEVL